MEFIKNSFILVSYYLTLSLLLFLILWRFRFKEARDIFTNINFTQGLLYLIAFFINILICLYLCKHYIGSANRNSFIVYISAQIRKWFDYCNTKIMNYIASLGYPIGDIIAYTTSYYLKLPLEILKIIKYIPQLLLVFTIIVDVFYLEQFYLSYYGLYLLLLTLLFYLILHVSIEVDERILNEAYKSYELNNPDPSDISHYQFTEFNTQVTKYNSIDEVLNMVSFCWKELKLLYTIKENLESPLLYNLFIRLFYTCIWGYIVYVYPFPVIKILLASIWSFLIIKIKFNIIILLWIAIIYKYNKKFDGKDK